MIGVDGAAPALLCGAWALDGGPVERLLAPERRRAMRDAQHANPRSRPEEVLDGPLWLLAEGGRLSRRGGQLLAWDGWLGADGGDPWALVPRFRGGHGLPPGAGPSGHFAAAWAEPSRGRFSLLREPTGGERLFFAAGRGLLLFSATARGLLAGLGARAELDPEAALERGLSELVHFGDGTLLKGVRELRPGHRLELERGAPRQSFAWDGLLDPLEGDARSLAPGLKRSLLEGIARSLGGERRAAVAVSGGLDSATVAALTCELLGPENVTALSFEYEDPGQESEMPYARQVARALGMKEPVRVPIPLDEYLASAPLGVWLTEDPRYWKRAYTFALSRAAAARGFDRYLTGNGVGSHLGFFQEFARLLSWLPLPELALRDWASRRAASMESAGLLRSLAGWRSALGERGRTHPGDPGPLARLHPGFQAPIHRLYYPVLCVLRSRGVLPGLERFLPPELAALVERLLASPRVADELEGTRGLGLGRQLQTLSFHAMNSCVDVIRCERFAREIGALCVSPAHQPASLPYCYLPARGADGSVTRPGKALLKELMRGVLPDSVIDRRKSWLHTVGSTEWRDLCLERMSAASGGAWEELRALFGPAFEPARRFAPEGMIPLAFWLRVFRDGPAERAPAWKELG